VTEDCLFSIAFASPEIPPLTVLRLDGREAMNELFSFDLIVCAVDVDPAALEARLLGARAVVSVAVPGGPPRTVAGLVIDTGILGRTEGDRQSFRLRIAPLAWLLTRRRNSRIFQDKTAPEIASIVLGEHGVPHRMTLVERYPIREYCVQYEESDWDFVTRLLAEEALFFWFEHPAEESGTEVLAVADSVVAYAPVAGSSRLRYRHDHGGALDLTEDMVTEVRSRSGIETMAFTIRDYDFERPGLELTSGGVTSSGAVAGVGRVPLEHYDHHGDYEETDADRGARSQEPAPAPRARPHRRRGPVSAAGSRRGTRSSWSTTTWRRSIGPTS
jgi:type VI secretion system secreted protein VgrG